MVSTRFTAAAAALCFGIGVSALGGSSAEAGPRIWTPHNDHNTTKGGVHIFSPPRLAVRSAPDEEYVEANPADKEAESAKTFTVTTVRPSRRWFRRHRALGQRYLGFQKQYTGQRFTGFKKVYRVRRNVVKQSRGTIEKGKDEVVITKTLTFPRARGLRDFRPSPEVTIIRYD